LLYVFFSTSERVQDTILQDVEKLKKNVILIILRESDNLASISAPTVTKEIEYVQFIYNTKHRFFPIELENSLSKLEIVLGE